MGEPGDASAAGVERPLLPPLSNEEHRILAYASAIGREFDFPLLAAAMDAHDETLAEQLERMTHVGVLRERPGGERFAFVQDEVRARIYQQLTASRLRVIHRKIAEAMERLYPEPPPEVLPELGRHYFLGKVPERSYAYNRQAAEVARQNDAPEEAAHHLERAWIDLRALPGDRGAEAAELAEELGTLYYSLGDVRAADRMFVEGLAKAKDPSRRARLFLARAEVARDDLDGPAGEAAARSAEALFRQEGDELGRAAVHRVLGRLAFHRGDYREALDEALQALDLLQRHPDPRILGRLSTDIGNVFSMLGPEVREDGAEWYRRAILRLSEVEDWSEVARAYLNLATLVGGIRPTTRRPAGCWNGPPTPSASSKSRPTPASSPNGGGSGRTPRPRTGRPSSSPTERGCAPRPPSPSSTSRDFSSRPGTSPALAKRTGAPRKRTFRPSTPPRPARSRSWVGSSRPPSGTRPPGTAPRAGHPRDSGPQGRYFYPEPAFFAMC